MILAGIFTVVVVTIMSGFAYYYYSESKRVKQELYFMNGRLKNYETLVQELRKANNHL